MLFCKDSLSFERTLNAAIFLLRIPPERDFTPFALVTNTLSNLVRGDEVSYEQSIELTERFLDLIPPCLQVFLFLLLKIDLLPYALIGIGAGLVSRG